MPSGKDVLFMADSIIDIDIGLMHLMKKEYCNPNFINTDMLKSDDIFFKELLMVDCKHNILEYLLTDNTNLKDRHQKLYDEFMKQEYEEIVSLSPTTDMIEMLFAFMQSQLATSITPYILCTNKVEEEYFKKINNQICCVMSDNLTTFDLDKYTRFIFRRISDIDKFNRERFRGKNLLILAYRFNFKEDDSNVLLEQYTDISDINIFESCIPYVDYEPPLG